MRFIRGLAACSTVTKSYPKSQECFARYYSWVLGFFKFLISFFGLKETIKGVPERTDSYRTPY
jgi:hypothetical protein